MKLYAPRYYKSFKCIADKCEHSCCIGWEIDVDKNTIEKYKNLKIDYGQVIRDSISTDDIPHFKLKENNKCPHLNEHGLCNIIINAGEEYLCDICREHPRFYNYTDVAELGIGMSCPAAAKIIITSPDYAIFDEIGRVNVQEDNILFNGRKCRDKIYSTLRCSTRSYRKNLEIIYNEYSINMGEDRIWINILDSLEYLDADHKKLLMNYSSTQRAEDKDEYLERFLAYMIYRHCTEAIDEDDFRDRLSFCLFCERLLASVSGIKSVKTLDDFITVACIISEEIEYSDENTVTLTYNYDFQ